MCIKLTTFKVAKFLWMTRVVVSTSTKISIPMKLVLWSLMWIYNMMRQWILKNCQSQKIVALPVYLSYFIFLACMGLDGGQEPIPPPIIPSHSRIKKRISDSHACSNALWPPLRGKETYPYPPPFPLKNILETTGCRFYNAPLM